MAVPLAMRGQSARITSSYGASCHNWPIHLGMSSLEFFFFFFFLMHVWEQEVALGTDTFEFRPVWGHWVLLLAEWLCGAW